MNENNDDRTPDAETVSDVLVLMGSNPALCGYVLLSAVECLWNFGICPDETQTLTSLYELAGEVATKLEAAERTYETHSLASVLAG